MQSPGDVEAQKRSVPNIRTFNNLVKWGEGKAKEWRTRAVKELAALDWHKISPQEAFTRLAVSPRTGLDEHQSQRRLQQHGKNVLTPPKNSKPRKVFEWVFGGFGSLIVADTIISFVVWKPLGGSSPSPINLAIAVVLVIIILIQVTLNAWQGLLSSRIVASIEDVLISNVVVLRDGQHIKVPPKWLVPGDIVTITTGEQIPADLRLINVTQDLQFDRSILTGESEAVSGRVDMTDENFLETKNVALKGTHCVSGSGIGLVVQTGDKTILGVIAKLSSTEQAITTTLQRELLRFIAIIVAIAIALALFVAILLAAWLRPAFPGVIKIPIFLADVVCVLIVTIPVELPVALTLSLTRVANILRKKSILCKSLFIIETLGSVNVLCSDKTGTLTQNNMDVENLAILDTVFDPESFPTILRSSKLETSNNLLQIVAIGAICNATSLDKSFPPDKKSNYDRVSGKATDAAILRFSDSITSVETIRRRWTDVYRAHFSSNTKFMLQLSELSSEVPLDGPLIPPLASWDNYTPSCFLLSVKGAPEILMPRCSYVLDPSGGLPIPISKEIRKRIIGVQEKWSRIGQRVLLLARRIVRDQWLRNATDRQSEEFAEVVEGYNKDLIIVGLVGLTNRLKPDIKHTVNVCRGAGIRFFIVTGDHPITALSLASQAGIITDAAKVHQVTDLDDNEKTIKLYNSNRDTQELKSIVVTGPQFLTLSPVQIEQLCQYEEIVFARTTPEQKLRIVHEFKIRGNVVAVTGDGANDAPSLKAADCGVAMGSGSQVAKEAADIILLGEFSSIIVAIQYGRLVYDNLKKACLYMLPAGTFSQLIPVLLNIVVGLPSILGSIQMIVICVATDLLPALSLFFEQPENELLDRKPRNVKTDRLVDWKLIFHAYGFIGVLESLCACSMSFWHLQEKGVPFSSLVLKYSWPNLSNDLLSEAQSIYFFTLVFMQCGNLFATRCRRLSILQHSPMKNIYVICAPITSIAVAFLACYIPWFQKIFQTRGIPIKFYFILLTFSISILVLDEWRKYIVRTYPRSLIARTAW